jgi:TonB family protein
LLSVALHASSLALMQEFLPLGGFMKPLRSYRVELIRPPVDSLDLETSGADLAARDTPQEPLKPESEETISLDTQDTRYSSYAGVIKSLLERHWVYPAEARENLLEGRLKVVFSLERDGRLADLKILEGSGYDILDGAALAAIRRSAPFPPFPGAVTVTKLHIRAAFDYRLTVQRP